MSEEIELILYKLEQNYKCDKEQYFILYKPDEKQLLDYINKFNCQIEEYQKALDETMAEKMDLEEENKKLKRQINKVTENLQHPYLLDCEQQCKDCLEILGVKYE